VISERTKEALQYKRSNGQLAGEVPFGYRTNGDGKTLEPIPKEQAVLKRIKSLKASSLSYQKIADRLNREGIPTKKGRSRWFAMSVRSVLLHNREPKAVNV
jgi:DNA invertase Pin-like site-specific DNA recombinase